MADKKSGGVEIASTPEKESKDQTKQNAKAKAGKPKPKSAQTPSKEVKDEAIDCVVESPKKKPVIVIDLTDDSEDPPPIADGKKVTEAVPQPVVMQSIKLKDLKETAIESMMELSQSYVAAFLGNRGSEKKGILELTLESDKDQKKALASLKKVTVSDKRELSATTMSSTDAGITQSLLSQLSKDASDQELTSVFINNIPPEARPGILNVMFPTARNIQFPQDSDGNAQGYAVLEVPGRKVAEEIVKHHELYIPKIGLKVLKLHIVGGSSVSEPDDEDVEVLSDDKSEKTAKKGKENEKANASSKTKQTSAKKITPDNRTKTKSENSKALHTKESEKKPTSVTGGKGKSTERKSDEDRSRSRSINTSATSRQRRDRSRSRDRKSSRNRSRSRGRRTSRRSMSPGRRDGRREVSSRFDNKRSPGSRDAPASRNSSREVTRESRSPGASARQSRWGDGANNQRTDQNARQRTQSLNDQVNQRGGSLTGLNGPHEVLMSGNVGPAGMRGGIPGLNNRDSLGQTVTRQGNQNIGPGNPISQQRNPMGDRYQRIGQESSIIEQRGQRNAMAALGNQTRDRPTPLVGPGSQFIPPTPTLLRQGIQGQTTPRVAQSNVMTGQGNRMAGQNSSITGQGFQIMGQSSQMNVHGTSAAVQMNQMYGQPTSIQQQRNQLIGQGSQLMGPVNQMTGPITPNIGQSLAMAQRNQIMGQANPMMGQSNPMMGQSNQMMGQSNPMMGQSNQMMGQRNPMMGQSNPMMGQGNQMLGQGNQMIGQHQIQGNQIGGQGSQMRPGISYVSQMVQPRSLTGPANLVSAMKPTMGLPRGNLPDATTPSLGRNPGLAQGQLNMGTSSRASVQDRRQDEISQLNSRIEMNQPRTSRFDDGRLGSQDVQRSSITSDNPRQSSPNRSSRSAMRRDDIHGSDSRGRLSDRAERNDTSRSSRFDRSRSPAHQASHDIEYRRGILRTSYNTDKFLDGRGDVSKRPSRFDDRGSGSRDRNTIVNKPDTGDRRSNREQQQQTLRGGPDVQTAPDLTNIRSQLLNTLRQLETGNLSDTSELADIAEKIKLVQQHQQKPSNPQGMHGSGRSGDLQREEPRSLGNPNPDRYNVGRGDSYEPRRDDRNADRYARRDSSGLEPAGNRSGDMSSKITIDYGHQLSSRSRLGDEQFPDTRIEQNYLSRGQTGQPNNYGSRTSGSFELGSRATNQRDIMSDSNRDLQRQGFAVGDEQSRRQTQQFGSGGMSQRAATLDSTWDMQRQGYATDNRTTVRDSFSNNSSQSYGAGGTMGAQGIAQTSVGQNQSTFRNPPPWQKSSNNPSSLTSTDIKSSAQLAQSPGRSKKVYVGNLPSTAKWDSVASFFNIEMWKRRMTSPVSLNKPVTGVVQAPDRSYAYVMFNTPDEADAAVLLDGIRYENNILTIK